MTNRFEGKSIVVTGGASGIGRAACLAFACLASRFELDAVPARLFPALFLELPLLEHLLGRLDLPFRLGTPRSGAADRP